MPRSSRRTALSLAAALAVLAPIAASAQTSGPAPAAAAAAPTTADERARTVEDLARALEANFVFPEIGTKYASRIRERLKAGAYDGLSDPDAFGEAVTADLMAVSKDGHLRLRTEKAYGIDRNAPSGPPPARPAQADAVRRGLEKAERRGDVAYLRFNMFPEDEGQAREVRDFLLANADAKAVVIDARPHRGGGLRVQDAIFPLLYGAPTTLVRMETRAAVADGGPLQEGPTLKRRESPSTVVRFDHVVAPDATETRLRTVPVYLLTSKRSASAAEHFALALKRTKRAILIGETTIGAGHYGGLQPIGDRFAAFVPVGRTYDPETGQGWEGTGIAPDIAVPAEQALDEALKRIRAAGVRTE